MARYSGVKYKTSALVSYNRGKNRRGALALRAARGNWRHELWLKYITPQRFSLHFIF